MPFDYKKEYREFYLPPRTPVLVDVPEMRFLAVRGIKPLFLTGRPAFDIGSALPLTAREP